MISRYAPSVRLYAYALAVVLAAAGCNKKGAASAKPTGALIVTLPVGPPVATPGERMVYRLTLKGVELGAFVIAIGDVVDIGGAQTVVVQAQAKSSGLASLVADIDDRFTSWIDIKTGRPRRFEVFEHADRKSKDKDHVLIDFTQRTGDIVKFGYALNDAPLQERQQKVSGVDVWDYNAFLLAIRGWEGNKGATANLEVFRSGYLWRLTITRGGKGTLVTELGELPVLRFDAKSVKLDREGKPWAGQPTRDFTLWISDDNDRVPLKLDAESDYGKLELDIVEYQPGTGKRLRP